MSEDLIHPLSGAEWSPDAEAAPESLLAALADITRHLLAAPDSTEVAISSLARLGRALLANRVAVMLEQRNERGRASRFVVLHEWASPGSASYASLGLTQLPAARAVLFASICRTGIGFQGRREEVPAAQRQIFERLGTGTLACAPFVVGEHYAGLLIFEDSRSERLWTRAEIDALAVAAQTFGAVRQRARIDQRLLAERERAIELGRANEALRRSVARVSQDLRVESVTRAFLAEVLDVMGAQGGAVMLRASEDARGFHPAAAFRAGRLLSSEELANDPFLGNFAVLTERDPCGLFAALQSGDSPTMQVDDLRESMPAAYAYHHPLGHRQLWHIPLRLGGELLGFTSLSLAHTGPLGDTARDVATTLAQQFALALELTRLAEDARQAAIARERELAAADRLTRLEQTTDLLREGVNALASDRRMPALITAIMAAAERQTGAGASAFYVRKAEGSQLRLAAAHLDGRFSVCGEAAERTGIPEWTGIDDLPAWQRLQQDRSVLVHGLDGATPLPEPLAAAHLALGHRTLAWIPVSAGETLVGLVVLAWPHERATLNPEQTSLLATLAQQLALTIELKRLAEEAQSAAVLDAQRQSIQSRAAELAHANRILQESAARLASATDVRSIATIFMTEALRASNAAAAALFMERAGGFDLVLCTEDGSFLNEAELAGIECVPVIHAASCDPASVHFARLRAGESVWRFVDAADTEWVPEVLEYHRAQGHLAVWDVPFLAEGKVIGYLSLAFRVMETPLAIVTETVRTLANQISVGIELTSIAARLRDSEVREAVSNERSRMARDIHDSLAQSFSSIAMQSEALLAGAHAPEIASERLSRTLLRIAETARHGIAEARATALALLPLDNRVGALDEALEGLARRCTIQDGMACTFVCHGTPTLLPLAVQEALLRIAQEALNNALRHSGGSQVELTVRYLAPGVMLTVQDDGAGLRSDDRALGGMGLKGMHQRTSELGGSFAVVAVAPHGTRIEVRLPTDGVPGR